MDPFELNTREVNVLMKTEPSTPGKLIIARPYTGEVPHDALYASMMNAPGDAKTHGKLFWMRGPFDTCDANMVESPFGPPGTEHWVKEEWAHDYPTVEEASRRHHPETGRSGFGPYYKTNPPFPKATRWLVASTLPEWASRYIITTVSVRLVHIEKMTIRDLLLIDPPFNRGNGIWEEFREDWYTRYGRHVTHAFLGEVTWKEKG